MTEVDLNVFGAVSVQFLVRNLLTNTLHFLKNILHVSLTENSSS